MHPESTRERAPAGGGAGYTLVELVIVLVVIGVFSTLAMVNYLGYVEKARVARAVAEIKNVARVIDGLMIGDGSELPDSLDEVGAGNMRDPWGNPYQYLKIEGGLPPGMSAAPAELPPVAAPPEGAGGSGSGGAGGAGSQGGSGGQPVIAKARKDQFLVPINSDYDLYSMGADGQSKPNLNTAVSRDDVIRARDGSYYGLAERF
jgi:general secretion pathway protein G